MKIPNPYRGPSLIFDLERLGHNLDQVGRAATGANATVVMAAKACTLAPVLAKADAVLDGFEISNRAELATLPSSATRLYVTNPALDRESVMAILADAGERLVRFHVDSMHQAHVLASVEQPLALGLRVALDEDGPVDYAERDVVRTRFGLDIAQLDQAAAVLRAAGHQVEGVHVHHYLKRNPPERFLRAARALLELSGKAGIDPRYLDLGGGLAEVGVDGFARLLAQVRGVVPDAIELIFEPGNMLFERVVYAVARVVNIKRIKGLYAVFIDLSASCHLRWSEPLLAWPRREEHTVQHRIAVFGPTCFEGDRLGEFQIGSSSSELPIRPGQFLVFGRVDPYAQAWNTGFNGIEPARVYTLSAGELTEVTT